MYCVNCTNQMHSIYIQFILYVGMWNKLIYLYFDSCLMIDIHSLYPVHYKFRHYCTTVEWNISRIFTNYNRTYEFDVELALTFKLKLRIQGKTKLQCGFIKLFSADILIRQFVISCQCLACQLRCVILSV